VRVDAVGVCGSDIAAYLGRHPYKKAPMVLGHEAAGTVVAIGGAIGNIVVGDRICTAAFAGCGRCGLCRSGDENLCRARDNLSTGDWHGAFATHVVLRESMVHVIPNGVPLEVAALIEPLAIARHALSRTDLPGRLVVVGVGGIGLACVVVARALGVRDVEAVDICPATESVARAVGATSFRSETRDGQASDVVVVTASGASLNSAVAACRPGGTVVVVAYHDATCNIDLQAALDKQVSITTALLATRRDFQDIIEMLSEGVLSPSGMVTARLPLREAGQALDYLADSHPGGKMLLLAGENGL
jgi:threonine dehydrogenase-like Zn-dependent dehydrogenase